VVNNVVKKFAVQAGDLELNIKEVKQTVKDAVKEAVREAVKDAVEEAVHQNDEGTK
jgi:Arc/MetJ family transcription regulator